MKKKNFIDTEFIEDGKTIELISIGIVCEDNREYYAINYDCDFTRANNWVKENVLANLPEKPISALFENKERFLASKEYKDGWRSKRTIAREVLDFLTFDQSEPETWGYYCAYDHVVLCQLYGEMIDLPPGLPMYMNDLKQLLNSFGNHKLPKQTGELHNALNDARWIKDSFKLPR